MSTGRRDLETVKSVKKRWRSIIPSWLKTGAWEVRSFRSRTSLSFSEFSFFHDLERRSQLREGQRRKNKELLTKSFNKPQNKSQVLIIYILSSKKHYVISDDDLNLENINYRKSPFGLLDLNITKRCILNVHENEHSPSMVGPH